jgi:hypothetical protein
LPKLNNVPGYGKFSRLEEKQKNFFNDGNKNIENANISKVNEYGEECISKKPRLDEKDNEEMIAVNFLFNFKNFLSLNNMVLMFFLIFVVVLVQLEFV